MATDRLYSLVRHPQYCGLFIALFGEGIVHRPTNFSVALFLAIALAYCLAQGDEQNVAEQFGADPLAERSRVPLFIATVGSTRDDA